MRITKKTSGKRKVIVQKEDGFSLLEMIIAILVMTVAMLGTLTVFTYAVHYNRGNNLRSQALTVLQQEAEIYRSTKFTSAFTDTALLGGEKTAKTATSADGSIFTVNVTVDNDPATAGIQTGETLASGKTCTLKEIKIIVTPRSSDAPWQTSIVTNLTIQRVRGN